MLLGGGPEKATSNSDPRVAPRSNFRGRSHASGVARRRAPAGPIRIFHRNRARPIHLCLALALFRKPLLARRHCSGQSQHHLPPLSGSGFWRQIGSSNSWSRQSESRRLSDRSGCPSPAPIKNGWTGWRNAGRRWVIPRPRVSRYRHNSSPKRCVVCSGRTSRGRSAARGAARDWLLPPSIRSRHAASTGSRPKSQSAPRTSPIPAR